MKNLQWGKILKVVVAVATALLGAFGLNTMS